MFVEGDFAAIDAAFARAGLIIEQRVAVEKSSSAAYPGWRLCGFPDFVVRRSPSNEDTSYVVEYVVRKAATAPAGKRWTQQPVLSTWQRHWHYGPRYFIWKLLTRLLRRDRKAETAAIDI
jgi:hypothetical protein